MSVDHLVFLRDERLPTCQQWQAALDDAKTGIVLEQIDDMRMHTGYWPAKYKGHDSGFEWYYGTIAEQFDDSPPDGAEEFTHAVNFVTHSDLGELACAMISGAILAQIGNGRVLDEESGAAVEPDEAFEIAQAVEQAFEKDLTKKARRQR
jgi:hypothetical protein